MGEPAVGSWESPPLSKNLPLKTCVEMLGFQYSECKMEYQEKIPQRHPQILPGSLAEEELISRSRAFCSDLKSDAGDGLGKGRICLYPGSTRKMAHLQPVIGLDGTSSPSWMAKGPNLTPER